MKSSWKLAPVLALPALIAAYLALGSGASAQGPQTIELRELEKGSTFKHVRNTEPKSSNANLAGDVIVFTNPVADGSGKVVGKIRVACVTTSGAADFKDSILTCTGVLTLPGGALALAANSDPGSRTTTGAITGGTGSYAGARGSFVASEGRKGGGTNTITLTD